MHLLRSIWLFTSLGTCNRLSQKFEESKQYHVHQTGTLDRDQLRKRSFLFQPLHTDVVLAPSPSYDLFDHSSEFSSDERISHTEEISHTSIAYTEKKLVLRKKKPKTTQVPTPQPTAISMQAFYHVPSHGFGWDYTVLNPPDKFVCAILIDWGQAWTMEKQKSDLINRHNMTLWDVMPDENSHIIGPDGYNCWYHRDGDNPGHLTCDGAATSSICTWVTYQWSVCGDDTQRTWLMTCPLPSKA